MVQGRGTAVLAVLLVVAGGATSTAARDAPRAAANRFFFSGDGVLNLEDLDTGAKLEVRFRHADGSYDEAALAQLRHLLRSRGDGREGDLSLRLIEQLDYVEDLARPRYLRIVSGYRTPDYNTQIQARGLKAATTSLHTQGLAADVQFAGIQDLRRLWLRIRKLECCGAGLYEKGEPFLHIDVGPARFWEPATSKVDQNLSGGNARIFARTDFDRYEHLEGARVRIHSITAFPLRVAAVAELQAGSSSSPLRLAPDGDVVADGDCLVVAGGNHLLRVASSDRLPAGQRARLQLLTCTPRIERTPERFSGNRIEILAPPGVAR